MPSKSSSPASVAGHGGRRWPPANQADRTFYGPLRSLLSSPLDRSAQKLYAVIFIKRSTHSGSTALKLLITTLPIRLSASLWPPRFVASSPPDPVKKPLLRLHQTPPAHHCHQTTPNSTPGTPADLSTADYALQPQDPFMVSSTFFSPTGAPFLAFPRSQTSRSLTALKAAAACHFAYASEP